MSQHRADRGRSADRMRIGGGLLIGALASGAMAAGALSTAGQAQASCVSAGGWFSIGTGCTTTNPGDFALAIGPGATAMASGGFNTAISWGVGASATATGVHNTAIAIGNAATGGDTSTQASRAISTRTIAVAGGDPLTLADGTQVVQRNNTAIAMGNGARSFASGGSDNTAVAIGNPDSTADPNTKALQAASRPTQAYAGDVSAVVGGTKADVAAQAQPSNHNTAIALGNGTVAAAGNGDNNYARAVGVRSAAGAFGGNGNRAVVLGNGSTALAGSNGRTTGGGTEVAAKAEPSLSDGTTSNGNSAVVVGNGSHAVAGPGNLNRARVFGNNSSARAIGDRQRVTSVGNDVHKSSEEAAQK